MSLITIKLDITEELDNDNDLIIIDKFIEDHLDPITNDDPDLELLDINLLVKLFDDDYHYENDSYFCTFTGPNPQQKTYPILCKKHVFSHSKSWYFLRSRSDKWFLCLYRWNMLHYSQVNEEFIMKKITIN